jgi:hypothetical protein
MGKFLLGLVVLAGSLMTPVSRAKVQFDVGARIGYAIPGGRIADHPAFLEDGVSDKTDSFAVGAIPIGLEGGIRVVPMLSLGLFAEVAPGILSTRIKNNCDHSSIHCTITGLGLGVMAHVHFLPYQQVDPWLGVGAGFGGLDLTVTNDAHAKGQLTFTGYEFPFRAGVDFKLNDKFYLGPYVSYTFGRYIGLDCDATDCPSSGIGRTASHSWTGFGAKLTVLAY